MTVQFLVIELLCEHSVLTHQLPLIIPLPPTTITRTQEKVTGSFKEGKVHEDVWVLQLKPALGGAAGAAAGGE